MASIVCISDTHGYHSQLTNIPHGDVIVHAGDCTSMGQLDEISDFVDWFSSLPHPHKVLVAGNHDWGFYNKREESEALLGDIIYLRDSGVEIEGLHFWGSPWQPEFDQWAFNLPRSSGALTSRWKLIPSTTDVLVTHGPPGGILDRNGMAHPVGCNELATSLQRVLPKAHIFGHIHESFGYVELADIQFVNASICNGRNQVTNPPIIIEVN